MHRSKWLWAALLPAVLAAGAILAKSTADHSKFPELVRFFQTPEEVTITCLR